MVQNVGTPNDPNLLPTSLQHALSQHQKAVGIPQTLHAASSRSPIQVRYIYLFSPFFIGILIKMQVVKILKCLVRNSLHQTLFFDEIMS